MRGRLPLLLITTLLSLTARAQDSQVNADWKQFRKLYPYHIQAVALSEVHPDGHRSLIVSEPPPQVTLENLEHVSPDFATAFTGKQPIGVDGWVKDVIFDLPPLSQTALSLDIDLLHRKLFGTAYKAYALAIPSVLQQPTLRSLDLHVGSSDLAAWLLPTPTGSRIGTGSASLARTASVTARPRITFTPLLGGAALTCETILKSQTGGVFLSQPAGMVLWSVSKSRPIDSLSVQIRRFAVDTDMIVGAVALGDQVAIIGRERTTDVSRLPPLRTETVLQLAAAKEDELEQSYERNILMAGPAVDSAGRSVDWAPILLSPRLIDTEYGSLLNITDQLLKGWSEHGEVKYVNFTYTAPPTYPFSTGLLHYLGADEVTYNWNTKGAGYVSNLGSFEIYALNRTGALPIDYLAKGRSAVEKAEDDAYNWYASLSDPNLLRVVEYAALYQIFHHFGIHSTDQSPDIQQPFGTLEGRAEAFLRRVESYTDGQLAAFTKALDPKDAHIIDDEIRPVRNALRLCDSTQGSATIKQLAEASVDRSAKLHLLKSLPSQEAESIARLLQQLRYAAYDLMKDEERSAALAEYRAADTKHPGRWIRTPSVVESGNTKSTGIGGHNLGSKVTLLEADESLPLGKVDIRVNPRGERILFYNPRDAVRANGVIREVARADHTTSAELSRLVERRMLTVRTANVSVSEGLGFTGGASPNPLRGLQASHIESGYSSFGWKPSRTVLADADRTLLRSLNRDNQVMLLTRDAEGKYTIGTEGGRSVQAADQASAIEGLLDLAADQKGMPVHLHMKGFDDRQASGFLSGAGRYTDDLDIVATREEDLQLSALKEALDAKYDLQQAKFSEVQVSEPDVNGFRYLDQEVEIPSKVGGLRGIVLRIRARFSSSILAIKDASLRMNALVREYFASLAENRDLRIVSAGLAKSLRREGFSVNVYAELGKERKRLFYVHNDDPFPVAAKNGVAA